MIKVREMNEPIQSRILTHLKSGRSGRVKPQTLAKDMNLDAGGEYHAFRDALRELMHAGRVVMNDGNVTLPAQTLQQDQVVGTYRHNRRGFGFLVPTDPVGHEDLYIGEGDNGGAMTGDVVRAKIVNRQQRDGKTIYRGKVLEIITRSQKQFVGSLAKQHGQWLVLPDGNILTEAILAPDAAARHLRPGTKVVIELTSYPQEGEPAQGVITRVLGQPGEKDVDLKSVLIQFNLPEEFPPECLDQARQAVDKFNSLQSWPDRLDLSDRVICTIDPDDAKDYDDAISLTRMNDGNWELGVHIADVSHFVEPGSPLDEESKLRGNSCYFPGFVVPMLPEILSNGVCSLQEGVPRLCKSAFIILDDSGKPLRSHFASTVIRSANRLRYREAQAIIDGSEVIPHPDGDRKLGDYKPVVVKLLQDMNHLAHKIQKRRAAAGQLVLDLPEIELVLDDSGKVVGAEPEDKSFTHTLIEMFMVEANEAAARLLDSLDWPFLRRVHPDPDLADSTRLRTFVEVAGFRIPKDLDRKALQHLLASVKGTPQSFTINLAVLKSLTRAEYSPQSVGHYALASRHYCHFTSPIRWYADLTIHRLLDQYISSSKTSRKAKRPQSAAHSSPAPSTLGEGWGGGPVENRRREKPPLTDADLRELGKHLSFTERRADDAERELRTVKVLELLSTRVGEDFPGVVTGITNFGIFVQLTDWLIDGLIRYEDLMDDWWSVDERAGQVRGRRTGKTISIGDICTARIVRVEPARRELSLAITELRGRSPRASEPEKPIAKKARKEKRHPTQRRGGRRR